MDKKDINKINNFLEDKIDWERLESTISEIKEQSNAVLSNVQGILHEMGYLHS